MMRATVSKQIISFTYYVEGVYRKTQDIEIQDEDTISDVMNKVGMPMSSLYIFFVNRKLVHANSVLKHGDVVKVIPALAGG